MVLDVVPSGPADQTCRLLAPVQLVGSQSSRPPQEASNAMALDGVLFRDNYIKIRRPNNYDANLAIMLGECCVAGESAGDWQL